jgi:integrase
LHDLDAHTLERFERWMRTARKFTDGGMAGIMRTIRAAYNRAEKAGMVAEGSSPFKTWSFSHLKNRKGQKAVPLEKIWALRDAECHSAGERFALDLFMFSFYMRGMNLADIAELRPGDVRDMRLWYVRRKTGRQYTIPVSAAAGAILDRYKGGERLFPVYPPGKMTEADKLRRRETVSEAVNKDLKALAAMVGIVPEGFTFYSGRHSYAMAHKQAGTPPEVIRELMGHSDFKTSEAYLSEFGSDVLDSADWRVF